MLFRSRRLSLTRRLSRSTSALHLSNLYLSVRSYLTRDAERPLMLTVLSLPRDATLYPSRTYAPRARQRRLAHAPTDPRTIPRRSKQWERWQSALELHRQSDGTLGSQDSLRQEDLRAGITQFSAETQKGRRRRGRGRRLSPFACQDAEPWCENARQGTKEGGVMIGDDRIYLLSGVGHIVVTFFSTYNTSSPFNVPVLDETL